jgi:phosphohistidine phosphatase
MRIYLVRHGDAVPQELAGSDRDRWLSARGREAARILARLLREQRVEPDCVMSSPLPRAVQTAELLASGLDFLGEIASRRFLEPGAQPEVAGEAIVRAGSAVLVVGHEPSISALAAYLLGRPAFPPFRTAQCYAIDDRKPTFTARSDIDQVQPYFIE